MAMKKPLSKVYWSDDVTIDPNIFFGTAKVRRSSSLWNTAKTFNNRGSTESLARSRTPSDGDVKGVSRSRDAHGKWHKGLRRLDSVSSLNSSWSDRRGTLLNKKVAEEARLSRENSFDRGVTPSQKRRFSSLARAGKAITGLLIQSKRNSSDQSVDLDDLNPLDKFKVMVKKIQVTRKMSSDSLMEARGGIVTDLGGEHRRNFSFGDVTLGALHKHVDKKTLVRLHKWGQETGRMKQLLNKFQRAVRLTIFCIRQSRAHAVKSQEHNEFSRFIKIDCQSEYEPADLLFDPSAYKAIKQSRITDEFVRIMSKQVQDRSQPEIYYAMIALRNIKCFKDFPARMQRKIAECGLYEKYDARRVIVRQGHPASSYYFILSGAVAVMVVDEGESVAKPMAYLSRGQTFGELAIINRSHRQSSIIAREESEFLTISVDDYHKIFMAGGVKTMNDPDHDDFMKSLTFLNGWPVSLLTERSNKCLFLYFKRGDVLVKDSQYSDWLIVVKSGSVAVLKKLKKVSAYEWKNNAKAVNIVTEKTKRERQLKKTLWKKMVLPELNVPLKAHDEGGLNEDYNKHFDENGDVIPFTHPETQDHLVGDFSSDTRNIWNFGNKQEKSSQKVSHIQLTQIVEPAVQKSLLTATKVASYLENLPKAQNISSLGTNLRSLDDLSVPAKTSSNSEDPFQSQIRTINTDLDSGFSRKDPDEITAADLDPEFVHIQTLTKGRVFGLSDLILGQQTSFCVVSNGADCLLISKQLFKEHMPEALFRQLRMDLCPYPTEEELQSSLQVSVDWKAFKGQTLTKTLKFVQKRRDLLQHLKA